MADYFNTFSFHIQGQVDIDAKNSCSSSSSSAKLCSIGTDDIICWRDLNSGEKGTKELPQSHGYNRIALHPDGNRIILGGQSKKIVEMSLDGNHQETLYDCLGPIFDLKISKTGRYIAGGTHEQKCILIDTIQKKKTKCRPGHNSKIINVFFSQDEKYVVSIGEDCYMLVYELSHEKDPQQVFRVKISSQNLSQAISACFNRNSANHLIYVPGSKEIQVAQEMNNHWEMKKTNISHCYPIMMCESLNNGILLTSCNHDICIWNVNIPERLIVLEEFPMLKIVLAKNTFYGVKGDGNIYEYNRPIPSLEPDKMDIQSEGESKIEFEEQKSEEQQLEEEEVQVQYVTSKKTKADKIITSYPQLPINRATASFNNNRFLYINYYGCIVENMETEDKKIQRDFHDENKTKTFFYNKDFKFFDMNREYLVYANENCFGLKDDSGGSWEKTWFQIQGITLGGHWIAVASDAEIKILDLAGNQIKSLCFDRQILTLDSYENLLVIVFHESIPMWGCQNISMLIYTVNSSTVLSVSECHVPIRPQSTLRWFGFSQEGMIYSQDSQGFLRAYSLQTNEWTSIVVEDFANPKKMWIVGIKDYKVLYWKTTDSEPEPTPRPRLNVKEGLLNIATLQIGTEELSQYPALLWSRYCLDHEMARWKLWGKHKGSRQNSSMNYQLSQNIMSQKQVHSKHVALDLKFYPIIQFYLKAGQGQKALMIVKTGIRSIEAGKNLIDMFDDFSFRNLAIDLEYYYEEKQRQVQYEGMQDLQLLELQQKAQTSIKPRRDNPMNPKFKGFREPKGADFNFSQSSQSSEIGMDEIQQSSSENGKVDEVAVQNPFLKSKPSESAEERKKQIDEQVQKFGVKRKMEEKSKLRKF